MVAANKVHVYPLSMPSYHLAGGLDREIVEGSLEVGELDIWVEWGEVVWGRGSGRLLATLQKDLSTRLSKAQGSLCSDRPPIAKTTNSARRPDCSNVEVPHGSTADLPAVEFIATIEVIDYTAAASTGLPVMFFLSSVSPSAVGQVVTAIVVDGGLREPCRRFTR